MAAFFGDRAKNVIRFLDGLIVKPYHSTCPYSGAFAKSGFQQLQVRLLDAREVAEAHRGESRGKIAPCDCLSALFFGNSAATQVASH
jgi:hypothetical protein